MKKLTGKLVATGLLLSVSVACFGGASHNDAQSFSPNQQQQIQQIVHDYLVNNPEVLVEASQALQNKEVAKAKEDALKGINGNKSKIFNDPASPTAGNPNGNAIVVEFFDYQCVHCKEMQPTMEKLLSSNS
ncbi:MAG: thioredoxin domain-containing protein, partial [Proteobacteria bacterium]|nr:thioredoxin domain-containing protein [Pseudomonadota bacterium]